MHSPFVGVPSFRGSLELNPLVLWIKAKEQVASLVNAGRKMVQDEARGTMCSWYIMCKWYYTKTFSRGANSNPEGCWIDTSLGTSFRFFLEGPGLYVHRCICIHIQYTSWQWYIVRIPVLFVYRFPFLRLTERILPRKWRIPNLSSQGVNPVSGNLAKRCVKNWGNGSESIHSCESHFNRMSFNRFTGGGEHSFFLKRNP